MVKHLLLYVKSDFASATAHQPRWHPRRPRSVSSTRCMKEDAAIAAAPKSRLNTPTASKARAPKPTKSKFVDRAAGSRTRAVRRNIECNCRRASKPSRVQQHHRIVNMRLSMLRKPSPKSGDETVSVVVNTNLEHGRSTTGIKWRNVAWDVQQTPDVEICAKPEPTFASRISARSDVERPRTISGAKRRLFITSRLCRR